VELAYNNKAHTGTKVSPFEANNSQNPRMGFKLRKKGRYKGAAKFAEGIKRVQEEVKAVLTKAQEDCKKLRFDQYEATVLTQCGGIKRTR